MDALKQGTNYLFYGWQMTKKLNGPLTGMIALADGTKSLFELTQKIFVSFGSHIARIERIERGLTTLKGALRFYTTIPMAIIHTDDLCKTVDKMSKKPSKKTLCKIAYLTAFTFSTTVGALQLVDHWGGNTLAMFAGVAAQVGKSRLFRACGMTTLEGFKHKTLVLGLVLMTLHAKFQLESRIKKQREGNPQYVPFVAISSLMFVLKTACCTSTIMSTFRAESNTWPVVGFNILHSTLLIAEELAQIYLVGEERLEPWFEQEASKTK